MSSEDRKKKEAVDQSNWETPSLKYVGNVGEIVQFPGGGKLSLLADDSGDEQRKPKGSEPK